MFLNKNRQIGNKKPNRNWKLNKTAVLVFEKGIITK